MDNNNCPNEEGIVNVWYNNIEEEFYKIANIV